MLVRSPSQSLTSRFSIRENYVNKKLFASCNNFWWHGVVVVTAAQPHKSWPQVLCRFKSCLRCVRDLRWWESPLMVLAEIRLIAFCWSTIPQKHFIIIIIIIIIINNNKNPSYLIEATKPTVWILKHSIVTLNQICWKICYAQKMFSLVAVKILIMHLMQPYSSFRQECSKLFLFWYTISSST